MTPAIPPLKHKEEFSKILAHYRISEHAAALFNNLDFVVLSGVAGGGRNTIIDRLVQQKNYYFIVSDTTRPPKLRNGRMEENGMQYWFRSEEDILADVKEGKFLEAELIHNQQVSGISLRELEHATQQGRVAIAEVEYGGANNIAGANPHAHMIGLLPPSFDVWVQRFRDREVITEVEYQNRMATGEKVISNMLSNNRFHIIINDEVENAMVGVQQVIDGTYAKDSEEHGRQVAQAILRDVQNELQAGWQS